MANFDPIIQWLLFIEDNKKTPGKIEDLGDGAGLTRLGLTSNNYGMLLPPTYFTTMNFQDAVKTARDLYKSYYWFRLRGDYIQSDEVAAILLSWAVNKTATYPVKALQHVLAVTPDGVLGANTISILNSKDGAIVAKMLRAEWEQFYLDLVALHPEKQKFLDGWLNNRVRLPYPWDKVPAGLYV